MSDTTNQMSLLDAIGLGAPEETKQQKESSKKAGNKPASKKKKKPKKQSEKSETTTASHATKADTESPLAPDAIETVKSADPDLSTNLDEAAFAIDLDGPLPLEKHLCFALYSANHAMHGVYKALLKEVGLTYPQFLAMTVLWDKNNVPVGAITSKLQLDTNTLTPLLKRLEALGLLTRTRSTKDERQVILKLTRKGKYLQQKTEHFNQCIFSAAGLDAQDILKLQAQVMKLRDNLRGADLS
ncbi:MAG: MarR family transcriptional regulator [Roseibium sp.]